MRKKTTDPVTAILIGIVLLAVLAAVFYHRAGEAEGKRTFHADADQQDIVVAPTPDGLEVFVPSGRTVRRDVTVVVNRRYKTTLSELAPGIRSVSWSVLKDEDGTPMPTASVITNAMVSYESEGVQEVHSFVWSRR
jgi:hypothetical protein